MSIVSAQVSLYPLRQAHLSPAIREAAQALAEYGLDAQAGLMSTLVRGEDTTVFAALREAFRRASELGDTVMVVTLSNACPLSEG